MGADSVESVMGVAVELTRESIRRHTTESLAARCLALSREMAEVSAELALASETMTCLPEGDRSMLLGESRLLGRTCGSVYALGEGLQTAREIDATGAEWHRPR